MYWIAYKGTYRAGQTAQRHEMHSMSGTMFFENVKIKSSTLQHLVSNEFKYPAQA